MKLDLAIGYSGPHLDVPVALLPRAEELGYDTVWSAEANGSDAITPLAFLAAVTNRIKLSCLVTDNAERDWPAVRAADRYRGQLYRSFSKDAEYVDVGMSKFILRALGSDDDAILAQTRLLIEKCCHAWRRCGRDVLGSP